MVPCLKHFHNDEGRNTPMTSYQPSVREVNHYWKLQTSMSNQWDRGVTGSNQEVVVEAVVAFVEKSGRPVVVDWDQHNNRHLAFLPLDFAIVETSDSLLSSPTHWLLCLPALWVFVGQRVTHQD